MKKNIEQFKKAKKFNYQMSFVSMMLVQSVLFSFHLTILENIVAYVFNLFGWIITGAVLELLVAAHYKVDLLKK